MSVTAMSWAWKLDLPATEKYLLVALCDHANDEDFTCYPSLTHLEAKTGLGRTTVWRIIDRLVRISLIARVGTSNFGTTIYRVSVGAESTQVQGEPRCVVKQTRCTVEHSQVHSETQLGAQRTSNHHEPSLNHQEPSSKVANVYPDWLDLEAWNEFRQHRKSLKAPLTPLAERKAIAELDRLRASEPQRAVIDRSIMNGWKGLFPGRGTHAGPVKLTKLQRANKAMQEAFGHESGGNSANRVVENAGAECGLLPGGGGPAGDGAGDGG